MKTAGVGPSSQQGDGFRWNAIFYQAMNVANFHREQQVSGAIAEIAQVGSGMLQQIDAEALRGGDCGFEGRCTSRGGKAERTGCLLYTS